MNAFRIKLVNNCNFACFYCRECIPDEGEYRLSFEEILAVCRAAVEQGISRYELVGGEPLLYGRLTELVSEIKKIPGVDWLSITTNGFNLEKEISGLVAAGLDGINIHMDVPDALTFKEITGKEKVLNSILSGIWLAVASHMKTAITVVLSNASSDYLAVIAGLAGIYPIDIRFVNIADMSSEYILGKDEALEILQRSIKGLKSDDGLYYKSDSLKGSLQFDTQIPGAFDMSDCLMLSETGILRGNISENALCIRVCRGIGFIRTALTE